MRSASAHGSGTVGYSTAHRAMPAVSGTAYSISERFADGLGNGNSAPLPRRPRTPEGTREVPFGDNLEQNGRPKSGTSWPLTARLPPVLHQEPEVYPAGICDDHHAGLLVTPPRRPILEVLASFEEIDEAIAEM